MRVLVRAESGPSIAAGLILRLDEQEAHHLRVRRAEPGQEVELRNGAGLLGTGVLEPVGSELSVRVVECRTAERGPALLLAVAAGDKDRFGWLAEKAAELGATDLVPVETARTLHVATRVRVPHAARLGRRSLEATKQSGAAWAPVVHEPVAFAAFIHRNDLGTRWLADAAGTPPPRGDWNVPISVLVGPEGGLTPEERSAAIDAGWHPISLGPHVLRFETAAAAAAAYIGVERARER